MMVEFNSMRKEVTQIGKSVHEIAKLQAQMAEQVNLHAETIEAIGDNTEKATSNVVTGNLEIRNAIQNNASTRAAIIFFVFMASFLLLALDWYTDKFDT